jgi:sensor c-di-GMP phosphodiesterase-like protein
VVRAGRQTRPDFIQQDGTSIYATLPQYRDSDLTVLTLQLGEFFVAFTPYPRMHLEPPPMRYTETAIDAPTQKYGRLLGDPPQVALPILSADGINRVGDSLYATQWSIRFFSCATAYVSLPAVLEANRTRFDGCILLCSLVCALAGFVLSLLYRRNKSLEQQLRRAIRKGKLRIVYQPLINLTNGRIVGAEALARWTDEDGHEVRPDVFVKIAEERGFVGEITELILRKVLQDFGETLRTHSDFRLSINVAAADLGDPRFLPMLEESLKRSRVAARSLAIEITEGSTARHELAMETICRLRMAGHSVHIDDFGTGYSSLAYLHELSVDAIKIDKSFTQAIGTGSVIGAILPQILSIAEALNLEVIAEGIETEEQADYFANVRGPILAQGWLYGRPVNLSQFNHLLAQDGQTVRDPALVA